MVLSEKRRGGGEDEKHMEKLFKQFNDIWIREGGSRSSNKMLLFNPLSAESAGKSQEVFK